MKIKIVKTPNESIASYEADGLRNAKYYIFNEKYTPEEYKKKINNLNLNTKTGIEKIKIKFNELLIKYPRRFVNSKHVTNCTGDYLKNAQNCKICFDIEGPAKDLKYSIYGVTKVESIQDAYAFGVNVEDCYEILGAGDLLKSDII